MIRLFETAIYQLSREDTWFTGVLDILGYLKRITKAAHGNSPALEALPPTARLNLIDPTLCFDSLAANPVFLSSACQIWQFIDHREPFWGKWYQGFQLWFLLLEGWTFLPWLALPTFFTFACNIWLLYFHSGYPNFYHRLTHNFVEFCCCSVRLWWDLLIVVWLYGLQHAKVSLV